MELCRHSECEILKTEAEDPNASEEFDPHDPAYTGCLSSKQFELVDIMVQQIKFLLVSYPHFLKNSFKLNMCGLKRNLRPFSELARVWIIFIIDSLQNGFRITVSN